MRILLISTDSPQSDGYGGGQRSKFIREALQEVGQVDTVWLAQGREKRAVSPWDEERVCRIDLPQHSGKIGAMLNWLFARKAVARLEASESYDFVVARDIFRASLVPLNAHNRLVFDCDDLIRTIPNASLAQRAFLKLRIAAIHAISKRAAHTWLVGPEDRAALNLPDKRSSVLFNTVRDFEPLPFNGLKPKRLLMVGLYRHPPNREGLVWFARMVMPDLAERFPGIELHAVGTYFDKTLTSLSPNVLMRGFVESLVEEYSKADVVVCPIHSGSGSQIKVLEGVLSTRPTVTSDFSYQPFQDVLSEDTHLLVASRQDEWIRKISAVLDDPDRFEKMGHDGRELVRRKYGEAAFRDHVIRTMTELR